MIRQFDMAVIGGDQRQLFMAEYLQKGGYKVAVAAIPEEGLCTSFTRLDTMKEAMEKSRYIIAPVPVSRKNNCITVMNQEDTLSIEEFCQNLKPGHSLFGGNIPDGIRSYCLEQGLFCYDFLENTEIAYRNAVATAEGTIAEAIVRSTGNLHQSRGLVLGYGRCAKVLALKLQAMGMEVTIGARSQTARTEAEVFGCKSMELVYLKETIGGFDYIFNTIPGMILTREILSSVTLEAAIIDIASYPGGLDYEAAGEFKLNAHLYLGIPGKVAPKASAKILADAVMSIVKERSD